MATPPGQIPRPDFPRFGLPRYASRFPRRPEDRSITLVATDGSKVSAQAFGDDPPSENHLPDRVERVTLSANLHCVTTWSSPDLVWCGIRLTDFIATHLQPLDTLAGQVQQVVFCAQDGYRTSLPITDCLSDRIIIADELNGEPLTIEHGAPIRLVAPDHYGYKNLKHLTRIELSASNHPVKRGLYNMLDHPRARVAHEERGRYVPGWLLRYFYRLLIPRTVRTFKHHMDRYHADNG